MTQMGRRWKTVFICVYLRHLRIAFLNKSSPRIDDFVVLRRNRHAFRDFTSGSLVCGERTLGKVLGHPTKWLPEGRRDSRLCRGESP